MGYPSGSFLGRVAAGVAYTPARTAGPGYAIAVVPLTAAGAPDPAAPAGGIQVLVPDNPGSRRRIQPLAGQLVVCRSLGGGAWAAERVALRLDLGPLLGYGGSAVAQPGLAWSVVRAGGGDYSGSPTAGADGVARVVVHAEAADSGQDSYAATPAFCRLRISSPGATQAQGPGVLYQSAYQSPARSDLAVAGVLASGPIQGSPASLFAWAPCYPLPLANQLSVAVNGAESYAINAAGPGVWGSAPGPGGGQVAIRADYTGSAPALLVDPGTGVAAAYSLSAHRGPQSILNDRTPAARAQATFTGAMGTLVIHE